MKLRIITFSLNRAMQLNTHLNSFYRNFNCSINFEHFVIYGATNEKFQEGYTIVMKQFPNVKFIKKDLGAHKRNYKYFLIYPRNIYWFMKYPFMRRKELFNFNEICLYLVESGPEFITFTTDDSYFYKNFNITETIFRKVTEDPKKNFFGIWQGKNLNNYPKSIKKDGELLTWSTTCDDCDRYWRNRFSIDFNIYHKKPLLHILRRVYFVTPNSLEGFGNFYATKHGFFIKGFCFEISPWVMFSLNQVQTDGNHMDTLVIDPNFLNERFLEGYELSFEIFSPPKIIDSIADKVLLKNKKNGDIIILK